MRAFPSKFYGCPLMFPCQAVSLLGRCFSLGFAVLSTALSHGAGNPEVLTGTGDTAKVTAKATGSVVGVVAKCL